MHRHLRVGAGFDPRQNPAHHREVPELEQEEGEDRRGGLLPRVALFQPTDQASVAYIEADQLPGPGTVRFLPQEPLTGLECQLRCADKLSDGDGGGSGGGESPDERRGRCGLGCGYRSSSAFSWPIWLAVMTVACRVPDLGQSF